MIAFAVAGDLDATSITCNTFTMQWPPNSGNWQTYPEVAKAAWFVIAAAKEKINAAQIYFLDELANWLQE